ncbi:photosystem II core complex proteins psbY, chloroplastic-like [Zingiber officinale]|uniref:Photosystem II core complex proteins psbY, chloroplastic n=1 Tax=Zingiber officinale TaxID=94328 RepID=A0A8J5C9T2_ZINOF|nr:photosystem II core complex proteins psbY, chloroplastic-like [Zingiber officinale]KAG6470547.1 hypothetical protein ZIOFF_071621 [Zingiber officinale]
MATMVALLNAKCPTSYSLTAVPKAAAPKQHLPLSLPRRLPAVPQLLSVSNPTSAAAALAGTVFAALATSDAAFAAQQIAEIAESGGGDSRGLALLLPIVPAVLWVLYNILQPALNQLSRMRAEKAVVAGLGLGAALAGLAAPPSASAAGEAMMVADAASSNDSRGLLLLFVVAPAILWVLYNILQPALNQINKMKSG